MPDINKEIFGVSLLESISPFLTNQTLWFIWCGIVCCYFSWEFILSYHLWYFKILVKSRGGGTFSILLLIYWSFHRLVPLMVGWSAVCCVIGLMAFLRLDLLLARLIFRCFLRRSVLTTSFHLNFGLPWNVGPSTLKLLIFFVHDVSSCQYKWPVNLSLFHLRTSSI